MTRINLLATFVSLSMSLRALAAIGPTATLDIVNVQMAPDGFNVTRDTVVAGTNGVGTFPGPLITGNKGNNFQINVNNQLSDVAMLKTTSIHWHGLFQKGTNWADGVAFVTQCPIASGNSFLYNFDVPDQAGTFWYHSHLSTQYCDGLRGALVVYDPNDPHASLYDVDDDTTVITLADWYHALAPTIAVGVADSTLINGLGRYGGAGGSSSDLAVVSVTQGKRYRFRLVSISCDPSFTFQIDGHNFTIIEADGINTQPLVVDQLQIFAAQRYSLVLSADQPVDNYWIRADPSNGPPTGFDGGINSAILRYVGANETEPTTPQDTAKAPLVETDLVPLDKPGVTGDASTHCVDCADVNINMKLDFNLNNDFLFDINGVSFVPPTVPVLLQILSGAQDATSLLPNGSVYSLPKNSSIQISLPAGTTAPAAGGPHPFHLHGHAFDVIRAAGQSDYNFDTPPRRDVVSTGTTGDNVTIRFFTDNYGPWFLHCHIDWHLQAGFAVVFAEDTGDVPANVVPPSAWDDLCPTYDALTPDELGGET
ncbi:laccase 1 [Punctularia strigosozonata HHB-11173 SS5]|uniref:laccase 1 n=1 Tax=Punctularia strigosozonata (strain HHB-11173) TaxID=741275 RepID=UPI0004417A9A|nr:laccase 1 [Punctularia strigosozonata HHB-11173 SS5]EIN05369.1 laccase 1 [Punctularia strigosozonata HHB-11173 SS5]